MFLKDTTSLQHAIPDQPQHDIEYSKALVEKQTPLVSQLEKIAYLEMLSLKIDIGIEW